MALVRSVTAASTQAGSTFIVCSSTSTKTGTAPRMAIAVAVEENVNDGQMTSSPGSSSSRRPAISRAWVHEVVSSACFVPVCSTSHWVARSVNGPSPCQTVDLSASST